MKWLSACLLGLLLIAGGCAEPLDQDPDNDWTLEDGGQDTGTEDPDTDDPDTDPPDPDVDGPDCKIPEPDKHRATPQTCSGNPPSGPAGGTGYDAGYNECSSHDDCSGMNARCVQSRGGMVCTHDQCLTDSDCGSGEVCECGGGRHGSNVCLPSECRTDADCGPGGWCSPSFGTCGSYSGTVGYFCHTCEDECTNDSDCGDTSGGYGDPYCMYDQQVGKWTCSSSHCAG